MFTSWKFHEFCEFLIGDGKNYLMYFSQELSHQIHYTIEHASNHRHQNINTYSYIYTDTSKYLPIYNFRRLLQDKLLFCAIEVYIRVISLTYFACIRFVFNLFFFDLLLFSWFGFAYNFLYIVLLFGCYCLSIVFFIGAGECEVIRFSSLISLSLSPLYSVNFL